MPEDEEIEAEEQEMEELEEETEELQQAEAKGYKCVNCEADVELDPVDDKIICPKCSHRVLMKKRAENPVSVEAK